MLLQVLMSELISGLASVLLFLENIFFAHICHTNAEVDFKVIQVPVNA